MSSENNNLPPRFDASELKMPNGEAGEALHRDEKKIGLIIILLVIALGLILVGLFLWYKAAFAPLAEPLSEERFVPEMPNEPEMPNAEAEIQRLETVSTSNDTAAIEADLLSTDLSTLDSEMLSIENELDAAVTE